MASQLAETHVLAQARIRALVERAVRAAWERIGRYDREDLDRWLELVLPIVRAGQRQSALLVDAYLAVAMRRRPLGIPVDEVTGAAVRNGTPPEEVYARPFVTVWGALAAGRLWEDAIAQGLDRATSAAVTDVQLSMRAAASWVGQEDDGIYGFRRVTDGDACDLCLVASTQRYWTDQLMPIHNHCGCSVEPITEPTGQVADRDLYRQLKADGTMQRVIDQRRAARARRRGQPVEPAPAPVVAIRQHGELGPVITNAADHFTGPAELAA